MKQRVKSAVILVAVTLICMVISPITRLLFFLAAALCCAYEYSRAVEKINVYCCAWVMYTYVIIQAVLTFFHLGPIATIACFAFAVYLALFSGILHKKVSGSGALYTLAGVAYPCFLFGLLMVISVSDEWASSLLIAFAATNICDAFALFGGSRFGKHKIAPLVSPNKTVEGCVSGAVSSIFTGIICYFILAALKIPETLVCCITTALVSSTLGQVGDLAESLLKRYIGIKDFSNLIPGHGGMFDRSDSLLFSIPTAYICIYLFHLL